MLLHAVERQCSDLRKLTEFDLRVRVPGKGSKGLESLSGPEHTRHLAVKASVGNLQTLDFGAIMENGQHEGIHAYDSCMDMFIRDTFPIVLRIPTGTLEAIDHAAEALDVTRSTWISQTIMSALGFREGSSPETCDRVQNHDG